MRSRVEISFRCNQGTAQNRVALLMMMSVPPRSSLNRPPLDCLNAVVLSTDGHISGHSWPQASCGGRQMHYPDNDNALDQVHEDLVALAKAFGINPDAPEAVVQF